MKFLGGCLDGDEVPEVVMDEEQVIISVKDGEHHSYPDQVVREWQVYVRKGENMVYKETKTKW